MYAKGGIPSAISRSIVRSAFNDTGTVLAKGTPVRLTSTGLGLINVSNEASANATAGLVRVSIANAQAGDVANTGIIEDIGLLGDVGDIIYVSKVGGLTNIKPSIGVNDFVAGDWVIRVGVLARNANDELLKDLLVNISIVGEL